MKTRSSCLKPRVLFCFGTKKKGGDILDIKNHFGNKRYGWLTLFLSAFNNNTLNYWPKKECCVVVGW